MTDLTIGERIMLLRRRHGLSIKELADRIGVTSATVAKYENDEVRNHSVDILLDMSRVLDSTINELVTGIRDPEAFNDRWFSAEGAEEMPLK